MNNANRKWSRDELVVAFNLYCKIPFGTIHIHNPQIIELAKALGRTPSAVSWKLANFARLDPSLQKRSIKGATHGSRADIEIWDEFNNDWDRLAYESEQLVARFTGISLEQVTQIDSSGIIIPDGREREALVRIRVNQGFFRATVLAAYSYRCCLTGLSISELLNASHIVPWAVDPSNRTNPRNGLCFNALHDRAFDRGLITVTPEHKIKVSSRINSFSKEKAVVDYLISYEGVPINLPDRFLPDPDLISYHNTKVFQG